MGNDGHLCTNMVNQADLGAIMYQSEIVQAIHDRIMSDESVREVLAAALRKVICTSIVNSIIDYYKLPMDFFRDVSCEDLKELGRAIIGAKEI